MPEQTIIFPKVLFFEKWKFHFQFYTNIRHQQFCCIGCPCLPPHHWSCQRWSPKVENKSYSHIAIFLPIISPISEETNVGWKKIKILQEFVFASFPNVICIHICNWWLWGGIRRTMCIDCGFPTHPISSAITTGLRRTSQRISGSTSTSSSSSSSAPLSRFNSVILAADQDVLTPKAFQQLAALHHKVIDIIQ